MRQHGSEDKLVLFSGDLFGPSLHSIFVEGEQMVEVLNRSNVDVSCMGNHELDFGIERMQELIL